jgi:hypothetical protein
MQTGERVQRLAAHGIRLVIGELRTDVTKTPPTRWGSRKDHAAKALKKLAGPQLPPR